MSPRGFGVSPEEPTAGPVVVEASPIGAVAGLPHAGGEVAEAITVHRSQWELFRRRFMRHRMALVSIGVLVFLFVVCFGADVFAPYQENARGGIPQDIVLGPVGPSGDHWFGTDELGRDQLSRLLYAGQISLKIAMAVALLSTIIGTLLGAAAGYIGGATDQALMRFTDLFLIVPQIAILAIAIKKFGNTDTTIILVLAGVFWMYLARVVRGQILSIKEKEFVEAARASGASGRWIVLRHILPNVVGPIVVNATLAVGLAIIVESTLSFLGLGVPPPGSSWGNMLSDADGYVGTSKSYLIYFPGLAILITVLAINYIGDGLRDAFDPQSTRS